jgi:hypothetical protein
MPSGARTSLLVSCALALAFGCNFGERGLVVSEIVSTNDNLWLDEWGQDEDYIELRNASDKTIRLGGYVIGDGSGKRAQLPDRTLEPGAVVMLVADGTPEQGAHHLPFKLSSLGDVLVLGDAHGFAVERVELPALGINEALMRFDRKDAPLVLCKRPSPNAPNGAKCAK